MGQACGHALLCRSQPPSSEIRGQQVFLRPEESSAAPALTTRQSITLSEQLQDALLRLAAVVDTRSLRVALGDSIQELLPSTECVCVYMLEGDSRLLSDDLQHELPPEGKIRNIVDQLKRCQCAGLPSSELPEKYRICLAAPLPAHKRAVIIPVLNQERSKAIAVLLVGCNPLSDQDELHLNTLEKHASVACVRVQVVQTSYQRPPLSPSPIQSHNALLHLNVSDQDYCELDRNILQLCGELYDLDAASLQLKVINYLQQQTQSQCCCLLLVSEDNHQLFCQVVGDKVLEEEISFPRHHFAQAIAILNTQGCNIFEKFNRKDYQRMLDLMRDIILATDLAHHLRIFKDLQKMSDDGYDPKSTTHRSMLLCLLMTSCDLSDQTKGWKTTRKIAELIYKEFFSQGDLEKAMGNRPSEMMDREKAYIPELQISFMEHIAMPIYKLLSELFPEATELYERVAANREQWTKVSHKFTIRGLPSNNSLDFLDQEYELLQSQGAFGSDDHCLNGCLDDAEGGRGQ
ncbi:cGMP-dependent 3',5'-cyclic phosphodiesterase [Scomber japonicus]|uniref:cGMP-dependent 3',5'-cyclic phosphodiesterase n=1 Tax=Scomber japonicus TaxID=13676 RepID=UPI0023050C16|nr:cGMP-dependent 3',5'-cyclic phosphodiesterase [Scomber japonicus]